MDAGTREVRQALKGNKTFLLHMVQMEKSKERRKQLTGKNTEEIWQEPNYLPV